MLVIHAILYMNRNVILNTEYMEYFCPAVVFLNGIATATEYMYYHIYADENGIDIYKWRKKEHVPWNQVACCLILSGLFRFAIIRFHNGNQAMNLRVRWDHKRSNFLLSIFDSYNIPNTKLHK